MINRERFQDVGINLLLTRRCNFTCGHCMYECGPNRGPWMSHEVLSAVQDQIRAAFADGALIVNWTGHGTYDVWSAPWALLDTGIVAGLPAQPGQPFVIVSNCLSGAVDYPQMRTIAEALLVQEGGGAIGVFASGGGTGSSGQFYLNQAVYQSIFIAGDRRFCDIVKSSLELARTMFVPDGDLNSFNLFADPMQRLKE